MRRVPARGETVYAGSLNYSGALTLRVTAAGQDTLLDDIERLLDKAVTSRSRIVLLADRAARFYAPMVHTPAALTCVGWLLAALGVFFRDVAQVTQILAQIILYASAIFYSTSMLQGVDWQILIWNPLLHTVAYTLQGLLEIGAGVGCRATKLASWQGSPVCWRTPSRSCTNWRRTATCIATPDGRC